MRITIRIVASLVVVIVALAVSVLLELLDRGVNDPGTTWKLPYGLSSLELVLSVLTVPLTTVTIIAWILGLGLTVRKVPTWLLPVACFFLYLAIRDLDRNWLSIGFAPSNFAEENFCVV
jgi:hypothetical protein